MACSAEAVAAAKRNCLRHKGCLIAAGVVRVAALAHSVKGHSAEDHCSGEQESHWVIVPVSRAALVEDKRWSSGRSSSPRDRRGPGEEQMSSFGSDLRLVVRHRRCWKRQHRVGRMKRDRSRVVGGSAAAVGTVP